MHKTCPDTYWYKSVPRVTGVATPRATWVATPRATRVGGYSRDHRGGWILPGPQGWLLPGPQGWLLPGQQGWLLPGPHEWLLPGPQGWLLPGHRGGYSQGHRGGFSQGHRGGYSQGCGIASNVLVGSQGFEVKCGSVSELLWKVMKKDILKPKIENRLCCTFSMSFFRHLREIKIKIKNISPTSLWRSNSFQV